LANRWKLFTADDADKAASSGSFTKSPASMLPPWQTIKTIAQTKSDLALMVKNHFISAQRALSSQQLQFACCYVNGPIEAPQEGKMSSMSLRT